MKSVEKSLPPCSCHESQSWGRATDATRAAFSGSLSANQRSFDAVNDATKTDPTLRAISALPPSSRFKSSAAFAERVSFHNSAGLITSPLLSSATMPCCCPAIEIAWTSSNPPASFIALSRAFFQCVGSTSVPSGCAARPWRTS